MSKSKFLKLKTTKLSDYIEVKTNRVLEIDDISSKFSSSEDSRELFSNILTINAERNYNRFLVQIIDSTGQQYQATELITLSDSNDIYTLIKNSITTEENFDIFADISGYVDNFNNTYLRFEPKNPYDFDYSIKILKNEFLTKLPGINTTSVGYVDLIVSNTSVAGLTTSTILELDSTKFTSIHSGILVVNSDLEYKNYVEIYLSHDGQDTYLSEFYFDDIDAYNGRFIGSFTSSLSGGILKLQFINDSSNNVSIISRNVGFGSTSVGVGTYRFKSQGQPDGSERTSIYDSNISLSNGNSPIVVKSLNKDLFSTIKSTVKVSIGNTTALHQLLTLHDNNHINVSQYPFLSIGSTSGIGTFGGEYSGSDLQIKFYPDQNVQGSIEILSFNESIYTFLDQVNVPETLLYTPGVESLESSNFYGVNSGTINRKNFDLKYQGVPIFKKTFDPNNTLQIDKDTGTFNIKNHFFSTGEELIYKPGSTFLGVGQTAVGIGSTLSYTGIITNFLPDKVYPIKINNDQFKIATRKEYAQSGIYVTFTSSGVGNAHSFEMVKKNEKSLISINEVIQYPLSYTSLVYDLSYNGGQIGTGSTIFALSGIGSIGPTDLLKINDEYVYISNVGLGTSSSGPISFGGTFPLVEVVRGSVGTSVTSHPDGSQARVYRGSFNIVGSEIFFTNPPRGSSFYISDLDFSNLERNKATFNGRVFLRKNYETNTLYDNISEKFTGLDQTYNLTVQGINTVGLGTSGGNGIVLINGIFQTPTTQNNSNNNFTIVENAGITSITFSGITDETGQVIISNSDINQNQLPRGGLIVSLGSTPGLGYAPLVGAKIIPRLNSNGSIVSIVGVASTGSNVAFTTAIYNNQTGILDVFAPSTKTLIGANQVKLVGLAFTCPSNPGIVSYFPSHNDPLNIISIGSTSFSVQVGTSTLPHYYVGYGTIFSWYEDLNFGSGYRSPVAISVIESDHIGTAASITATVGAGGTLALNIGVGGTGYINPRIQISPPSYENLPVIGVSRLGIGQTTETGTGLLLSVEVGASSTSGIGSTTFQITSYKIKRNGYGFRRGDVFKPVGLVTAKELANPINEFELTVIDIFNDSFAAWQFGELNYIDSVKNFQDGVRTRFPLYYNSSLLSFEKNNEDLDSQLIDLDSLLVIFINGVLQTPKKSYQFEGGTSFTFTTPPKSEDNISIFFYVGTSGVDSLQVPISETLRTGDQVKLLSNNNLLNLTVSQDERIITDIAASDKLETALYTGLGINEINERPLSWIKQKRDLIINNQLISKSRDSLEPQIYPTAKVIRNFNQNSTDIFVDSIELFKYDNDNPSVNNFDLLLASNEGEVIFAGASAVVSSSGTIQNLTITNPGLGYTGNSVQVKFSAPSQIGVGIGTTALATLSVVNGQVSLPATITNPGLGYTANNPPQVIVETPKTVVETLLNVSSVSGFSGIVTAVTAVAGINTTLAFQFNLYRSPFLFPGLQVGYPIYIFDSIVGNGVTSIQTNDSEVIGISTRGVDNVYYISAFDSTTGIITCNVKTGTDISNLGVGSITSPVAKFSWGKIGGFSRGNNPLTIVVDGNLNESGLSTYPTIQRKGYGLRNTGSIKKAINSI